MTDLELLVALHTAQANAFGYGSYRYENREQRERFMNRVDRLSTEAEKRGLITEGGDYTDAGRATGVEADSRVKAKTDDNQAYFASRLGGRGNHFSPYGEG